MQIDQFIKIVNNVTFLWAWLWAFLANVWNVMFIRIFILRKSDNAYKIVDNKLWSYITLSQ